MTIDTKTVLDSNCRFTLLKTSFKSIAKDLKKFNLSKIKFDGNRYVQFEINYKKLKDAVEGRCRVISCRCGGYEFNPRDRFSLYLRNVHK